MKGTGTRAGRRKKGREWRQSVGIYRVRSLESHSTGNGGRMGLGPGHHSEQVICLEPLCFSIEGQRQVCGKESGKVEAK